MAYNRFLDLLEADIGTTAQSLEGIQKAHAQDDVDQAAHIKATHVEALCAGRNRRMKAAANHEFVAECIPEVADTKSPGDNLLGVYHVVIGDETVIITDDQNDAKEPTLVDVPEGFAFEAVIERKTQKALACIQHTSRFLRRRARPGREIFAFRVSDVRNPNTEERFVIANAKSDMKPFLTDSPKVFAATVSMLIEHGNISCAANLL